jgi:capsule polysaccharide export protein KpsE/RkpR
MKKAALSDQRMEEEVVKLDALVATLLTASHNKVTPDINVLKRKSRILKNRLAAKKSRESKKDWVQGIQEKLARLEKENLDLRKQLAQASVAATQSRSQAEQEKPFAGPLSRPTQPIFESNSMSFEPVVSSPYCIPPSLMSNSPRACLSWGHALSSLQQSN